MTSNPQHIYNTRLTLLPCLTQLETSSRIETLSSSWYDLQSVVKCSLNQQRKLIYFRVICAHVIGWFFSNLTWFNKHPKGQSPKDGRLSSISYSLFYFSFYTSIEHMSLATVVLAGKPMLCTPLSFISKAYAPNPILSSDYRLSMLPLSV